MILPLHVHKQKGRKMTKQTDRNGEKTLETESPEAVSPDSPKQVVFRSKDKELTLVFKAGYMDKSHGQANYNPSDLEAFEEYFLRIDDIPSNKKRIEKIRNHPQHGISFKEVPDMRNREDLPSIPELEAMSTDELRNLCGRRKVEITEDASREAIMLALIKAQ